MKISVPFKIISISFMALLLVVGLVSFITLIQFRNQIEQEIEDKLSMAVSIAETVVKDIPLDEMTQENFTTDQFFKPWSQLRAISDSIGFSSIYVMRFTEGKFIFVLDSISDPHNITKDSDHFQVYRDIPPALNEAMTSGKRQFTKEPYTDEFGTFQSVFAKVVNGANSSIYAIGADYDISVLQAHYFEVVGLTLIPAGVIFLVVIGIYFLLIRIIIMKPFKTIILGIANNNKQLGAKIEIKTHDEFKILAAAFNSYSGQLAHILGELKEGVSGLEITFAAVLKESDTAQEETINMRSQLAGFEAGISNLYNKAQQSVNFLDRNSQVARDLESFVSKQASANEESRHSMDELLKNLGNISQTNESILNQMKGLEERSHDGADKLEETSKIVRGVQEQVSDIRNILEVINGIAKQTNILAMNAAIEAAHAGESGKGFAVVADEIKKLAEQSSINAQTIEDSIKGIVEMVQKATLFTDQTMESFRQIDHAVETTFNSFDDITRKSQTVQKDAEIILEGMDEIRDLGDKLTTQAKGMVVANNKMNLSNQEVFSIAETMNHETEALVKSTETISQSFDRVKVKTAEIHRLSTVTDSILDKFKN